MKLSIICMLLIFSQSSFASDCLKESEQKELGEILIKYDIAMRERPGCQNMSRGAYCLRPIDVSTKNYLEYRLKLCFKEQQGYNAE